MVYTDSNVKRVTHMNFPTVKSLRQIHDADHALMREIGKSNCRDKIMSLSTDAAQAVKSAHGRIPLRHLRMIALNQAARTHGVEYLETKRHGVIEYLNTGDTYAATLVRFPSGFYTIKSWGDIVESDR